MHPIFFGLRGARCRRSILRAISSLAVKRCAESNRGGDFLDRMPPRAAVRPKRLDGAVAAVIRPMRNLLLALSILAELLRTVVPPSSMLFSEFIGNSSRMLTPAG